MGFENALAEEIWSAKYRFVAPDGEGDSDSGIDATHPAFWMKGLDVISGFIDELEKAS